MTRIRLIRELERIRTLIVDCEELSDYAREKSCIDISDAIKQVQENYE